ncbi:MAG: rod shape-determining protein MreD [Acidimicrobiales bacterium]
MTSDPRLRVPLLVGTALVVHLSVLTRVRIVGVMPDLMLLLAVAAGITGGQGYGAVVGFASGMAVDLFLQTPLGLSALVFTVIGYAVGLAQTGILRSSWWIPLLTAFVASAVGELAFAAAGAMVGEAQMLTGRIWLVMVVVGATNAFLAPLTVRTMSWALARRPAHGAYVV